MFLDLLAVNLALLLAEATRSEQTLTLRPFVQKPLWFVLLAFLWLLLAHAFDIYDPKTISRLSLTIPALLKTAVLSATIYLLIPCLTPALPTSRRTLFSFLLFIIILPFSLRSLYSFLFASPIFRRRSLIIGTGQSAQGILQIISEKTNGMYRIVGFVQVDIVDADTVALPMCRESAVDPNQPSLFTPVSPSSSGFPIFSLSANDGKVLKDLIIAESITTLILACETNGNGRLLQILSDCLELGVEIIPLPVLYEQLTGRVPVLQIGDAWHVAMPLHHPGTSSLNRILKRAMDIALSSIGLLFLGFVSPFIALAIYIDSPGPIFYKQARVGKNGRSFTAYKFRSMIPNAEKGAAVWARRNDHRATRVGRLLRKTHLDEFPQFMNIFKGEMSVVGPRPERPEFVEELAQEIPFYRVRHATKPGMAGWGLVKQGYGASKEDALIKLQYDLYYIKHQSLWLDTVILLKTAIDMATFHGRA